MNTFPMISMEFCSDFHQILDFIDFSPTFVEPKIYLYLVDSNNFGVLKSYESESFISGLFVPLGKIVIPPDTPSFQGFWGNPPKLHNVSSAPP